MNTTRQTTRLHGDDVVLLSILFVIYLIIAIGVQMISGLIPAIARLLDVSVARVTLLVAIVGYSGLSSPLFGPLADRFGYMKFVLLGFVCVFAGILLSAFAPDLSSFMVCVFLIGTGYAVFNFSLASGVGELFEYEMRGRIMGILRFAWSASALAGVPFVMAIAGWLNVRWSFASIGLFGFVVFMLFSGFLNRRNQQIMETRKRQPLYIIRTLKYIRTDRSVLAGLVVIPGLVMVPTGTVIYLAAWLENLHQLNQSQIGLVFSVIGIGAVLGNVAMTFWSDRFGKKRSALIALSVLSIAVIILPYTRTMAVTIITLLFLFAALEFGFVSLYTIMTELMPAARGTLMSIAGMMNSLGVGTAPVIFKPVWEYSGYAAVTLILGLICAVNVCIIWLLIDEGSPGGEHANPM